MIDLSFMGRGQPTSFNVAQALQVIEQMIEADEPMRALQWLDSFPAYYREFPTPEMLEVRRSLHRQLWTPVQYKGIYDELEFTPGGYWPLRAQLLENEVRAINGNNEFVAVLELAPGGLFLEQELKEKGLRLGYVSMGLDGYNKNAHAILRETQACKHIFIAFELIEHLHNEWEIYQNYLKFGREADIVMISTPLFTYGGGMPDWRNRPLGHLRCYTPTELHAVVSKMFQGYEWTMQADDTLIAIGRK